MSDRGTVLVVGGGVIGVCTAYYLARDGWQVTLVEKGEIASGSSYGNAGLVVPSHAIPLAAPGVWLKGLKWMRDPESPFYIKPRVDPALAKWLWQFRAACTEKRVRAAIPVLRDLSRRSLEAYREFAAMEGLDFGFHAGGLMTAFRTRKALEEGKHELELLAPAGVVARVLDGAAARELVPGLAPGVIGAVHLPEDAHLIPDQFVTGLARVVEAMGVTVRRETDVLGFKVEGRRVVAAETTRGDLEADELVVAAGSWSPGVVKDLKLKLPIQPAKGYSITWKKPANSPPIPVMMGERRASITPMGETLRVAGTLELAGMDLSINRRRVAALARAAGEYIVGADQLEVLEVWRGLRPCTPDGLPIIGRPSRYDNLTLATGHAMIGMSLGPASGKVAAEVVARETPSSDIALLAPQRFGQ